MLPSIETTSSPPVINLFPKSKFCNQNSTQILCLQVILKHRQRGRPKDIALIYETISEDLHFFHVNNCNTKDFTHQLRGRATILLLETKIGDALTKYSVMDHKRRYYRWYLNIVNYIKITELQRNFKEGLP